MKAVNDLLKTPQGKYSRKSIMIVITFTTVISMAVYLTVTQRQFTGVFDSLLIFLGTLTGISEAGKKFTDKVKPPEE